MSGASDAIEQVKLSSCCYNLVMNEVTADWPLASYAWTLRRAEDGQFEAWTAPKGSQYANTPD